MDDEGPFSINNSIMPVELATDREPWERQPGEESTHWQLFRAYRDLPPVKRSFMEAYRVAFGTASASPTSVYSVCTPCSRLWRWDDRVELYDRFVDSEIRKTLLAQQIHTRKKIAELGMMLRVKAAEALASLEIAKELVVLDPDTREPKTIQTTTLSPSAIVAFAKAGAALESEALGIAGAGTGGGVQVNVGVGVGVTLGETSVGDDTELLREAARILRARKEQLNIIDGTANPA